MAYFHGAAITTFYPEASEGFEGPDLDYITPIHPITTLPLVAQETADLITEYLENVTSHCKLR